MKGKLQRGTEDGDRGHRSVLFDAFVSVVMLLVCQLQLKGTMMTIIILRVRLKMMRSRSLTFFNRRGNQGERELGKGILVLCWCLRCVWSITVRILLAVSSFQHGPSLWAAHNGQLTCNVIRVYLLIVKLQQPPACCE